MLSRRPHPGYATGDGSWRFRGGKAAAAAADLGQRDDGVVVAGARKALEDETNGTRRRTRGSGAANASAEPGQDGVGRSPGWLSSALMSRSSMGPASSLSSSLAVRLPAPPNCCVASSQRPAPSMTLRPRLNWASPQLGIPSGHIVTRPPRVRVSPCRLGLPARCTLGHFERVEHGAFDDAGQVPLGRPAPLPKRMVPCAMVPYFLCPR